MHKKEFIQRFVIKAYPTSVAEVDEAVKNAKGTWNRLCQLGFGDAKVQSQRDSVDYYSKLSGTQKDHFDRFWEAFGHKVKRNNAASAWLKLGPMDDNQALQIVAAAKAENKKPRRKDEIRMHAQGWLNQRVFDDFSLEEQQRPQQNYEQVTLLSELAGLEQLGLGDSDRAQEIRAMTENAGIRHN